jgi:hypothetical protein
MTCNVTAVCHMVSSGVGIMLFVRCTVYGSGILVML